MLLSAALAHALVPTPGIAPCGTSAMRAAIAAGESPFPPQSAEATGYNTAHFHIEGYNYSPTDEEYQLLGEILEEVWAVEVETLGYLPPYGDGLFTAYLEPMPDGLYGYTSLMRDGRTAYVAINPDMSWTGYTTEESWKVTAAHEFFHAVQYEYDFWEPSWWMESTATWMEDEVYDEIDDYANYLSEGSWPEYPEISMVAENGWHEYGEVIWPRYLSTFYGGGAVIQSLWESCVDQSITEATVEFFGSPDGFTAALVDFEVRNVLDYAGYEEGALWYPVYTRDLLAEGAILPATATPTEYYADYLGVNYWRVAVGEAAGEDLVVDFTGNPMDDGTTVSWQVTLLLTDGATWDQVTTITTDVANVRLSGFGTTWTEGWVLVGILSRDTGVDHDQYASNPRYFETPPSYTFEAQLAEPLPVDTGSVDTAGEDTAEGDTASDDTAADDTDPPQDSDAPAVADEGREQRAGCACDSSAGRLARGVGVALALCWVLRRRLSPVLVLPALTACVDESVDTGATTDSADDPLLDAYLLNGDDSFPESVAWDPQVRAFYTSSLGRGDVSQVLATGESSVFFADDGSTPWVTVGLEVDAERRRLWACASVFDGSTGAQLWMLDLDSAERILAVELAAAREEASCTDVNLSPDGVAFVTDRANPAIYRVDPAEGVAELWLEDPMLEPGFIGQNGVAFTPDGANLIVTKYLPVELLRVPLDSPGEVSSVELEGEALQGLGGLSGADDIVFLDDTLYATLVDRLFALSSTDGNWSSATARAIELPEGGMTGLAVAEGSLFGSNGQAVEYSLGTQPETPFWIHKLALE